MEQSVCAQLGKSNPRACSWLSTLSQWKTGWALHCLVTLHVIIYQTFCMLFDLFASLVLSLYIYTIYVFFWLNLQLNCEFCRKAAVLLNQLVAVLQDRLLELDQVEMPQEQDLEPIQENLLVLFLWGQSSQEAPAAIPLWNIGFMVFHGQLFWSFVNS